VPNPPENRGIPPEKLGPILAAHYRGLGHMERYEYEKAEEAFREVRALAPEWVPGLINLAISLKEQNWTDGGKLRFNPPDEALDLLDDVLKREPGNLHAHYCRGLIYEAAGLRSKAHSDFQFVVDRDPNDAQAWYMLGSTLGSAARPVQGDASESKRLAEEIADYQKALACNPYLMPAMYKLAMAHHWTGDTGSFRKWIERWSQHRGFEKGYGHGEDVGGWIPIQGRYAQVINPLVERSNGSSSHRPPRFGPATPLSVRLKDGERWASSSDFIGPLAVIGRARGRFGAPIAAFDADGNGKIDIFLPASIVGNRGVRDALLLNTGDGSFEDATERLGLPLNRASLGVAAGDFDADGRIDLFLSGAGDNRLFRNDGIKGFTDVTQTAGVAGQPALSLSARWLDLDQDGDLDLYVVNYAPLDQIDRAFTEHTPPGIANAAYRNDGKPSPVPGRPETEWAPAGVAHEPERGTSQLSIALRPWPDGDPLAGEIAPHTGIAALDIDADRDLDLVLTAEGSAPQVILNDRLGRYHTAAVKGTEPGFGALGLLVTNLDRDGIADLVTLDADRQVSGWNNRTRRDGSTVSVEFERWPCNARSWRCALAADLDLDGSTDLLGLPSSSELPIPAWVRNEGTRLTAAALPLEPDPAPAASIQGMRLADTTGDSLPDLIVAGEGEAPRVARNLGNGNHWLALTLSGRWTSYGRLRSNPHGTGARVWLQGPALDSICDISTPETGLSQSVVPTVMGLGDEKSASLLKVRWPDGMNQCELNIPADHHFTLAERTHRTSTCPILFAWDGSRFQCVCDLLAGGGLGYYLGPDFPSAPDRDESVAIAPELLRTVNGTYRLIIAEPMDEVAYLDQLTLDVVDRPAELSVAPDERFVGAGEQATGRLLTWKTSISPERATDLAGRDLTQILRDCDRQTADRFRRIDGLNGYAEDHGIVLDFGDRLAQFGPGDRLILGLAGWVEYPFSQTNYAAATAGIALKLPVLERQQPDGSWKVIDANAGCPAGLTRLTTRDVTGKLTGTRCVIRLRTNLECYWDQAFVATIEPNARTRVTPLRVSRSMLGYRGYVLEASPDGRMPMLYDYDSPLPMPLAQMSGMLTRYGNVTELLTKDDDHLCLVGPGDEVRIEFDSARVPPLPAGWNRIYVLRAVGYCKDADLFTAAGDTVGPLPWRGMTPYPFGPTGNRPQDPEYEAYLREYQIRPAGTGAAGRANH
jgi:hypothetical protein